MLPTKREKLLEFLRAITNPAILERTPAIAVIFLTTLTHAISSVDLGFRDLHIRIPIAVISILPFFLLIKVSQLLAKKGEKLYLALIISSYLVGGAIRGAVLEFLLWQTNVLDEQFTNYRVIAGITIVTITASFVSYSWTTTERAREKIIELQNEALLLTRALEEVSEKSGESNQEDLQMVHQKISSQILRALQDSSSKLEANLNQLIYETIRPLSQDFAKEIRGWQPPQFEKLELSFESFWRSIDPVKHLKTPVVGIVAMMISAGASLFALFDLRNALEVVVAVTISLLISTFVLFRLASRFFQGLKSPIRDIAITLAFFVSSIPAVFAQRFVLSDTADPNIYAAATVISIPVFGWIVLTGSAALALSNSLTDQLSKIRDDLRWVVTRINLLDWYRKGLLSRLLHGPIQNSIQVALLRLKSADESQSQEIFQELIQRIDVSLRESLDPEISTRLERKTLDEIIETWKRVANISLNISEGCFEGLSHDLAAATIVTDLLQEVCSNTIRHGGANQIEISADTKSGSIYIQVKSNGTDFIDNQSPRGLGSEFLNACSIEWSRKFDQRVSELSLRVPTTYQQTLMEVVI